MRRFVADYLRLCACVGFVGQGELASAEDREAEVAAALGPFVGLLWQHCADEADDGVAIGEISTTSAQRRISR